MILSHPLFGGFDVGPGLAETYVGNYHRFVAPSRFGYLARTRQRRQFSMNDANSIGVPGSRSRRALRATAGRTA